MAAGDAAVLANERHNFAVMALNVPAQLECHYEAPVASRAAVRFAMRMPDIMPSQLLGELERFRTQLAGIVALVGMRQLVLPGVALLSKLSATDGAWMETWWLRTDTTVEESHMAVQ